MLNVESEDRGFGPRAVRSGVTFRLSGVTNDPRITRGTPSRSAQRRVDELADQGAPGEGMEAPYIIRIAAPSLGGAQLRKENTGCN